MSKSVIGSTKRKKETPTPFSKCKVEKDRHLLQVRHNFCEPLERQKYHERGRSLYDNGTSHWDGDVVDSFGK